MHGRASDHYVVKTLQVGSDSVRAEMIVLPLIQKFTDDCRRRGSGCVMRRSGPISQAALTLIVVALRTAVERRTSDLKVSASLRYLSMLAGCELKDFQPPGHDPGLFCFCHAALLSPKI